MSLSSLYQSLSQDPGVYIFQDREGNVLYVGKARNLKKRVSSYFKDKSLGEKTKSLVSQIAKIKTIIVESEIESLLLEANFIQKYKPKYNVRFTDGKAYPLIRITIKDKFPLVLTGRRILDKSSLYFGPFPNAGALRLVLKTIRRIFPFQSVINHPKKPCLYYHLGLCPCPEVFEDESYRKSINHIVNFLNGKTKKVIKDLEKEREELSKSLEFEKAEFIQKKIIAVKLVTSPFFKPFDYEENPNLTYDLRKKELDDLKQILKKYGVNLLKLEKIECFDISNFSGKEAVGSMIVFVNGEKETNRYRRFKIRKTNGRPNDTLMMSEVLERRLNHSEWEFPDLIVVDGGKGQVSSASFVLSQNRISIPVIGLAKREETIITQKLSQISLPKDSKSLHLLMRIRDEAHRFAIAYHKKLRGNYFLETT